MQVEEIHLTVGDESYPGRLNVPEEPDGRGVVVRPGGNHGPYGDVFDEFAEAAAEEGVHVLRFESWETSEEIGAKRQTDIHEETDAAIGFLRDRGCSTVDVVGKSFGGGVTLTGAPEEAGRLVLWAPAVEYVEALDVASHRERPIADIERPKIDADALGTVETPTLVLHGDEDGIPLENSEELVDALPNGELVVLEGGDHSFEGVEDETVEHTLDFLRR